MTEKFDRINESCTVSGTGDITLDGVFDASFVAYGTRYSDGDIVPYCVTEKGVAFEIGLGVFTVSTGIIARTAAGVIASSNADSLVVFASGTKTCHAPADSKFINKLSAGINTNLNNIALLHFYRAIDNGLAIQNMIDGIVDEFSDETGVNTSAGSTYDYNNNLFINGAGSFAQYPVPFSAATVKATDEFASVEAFLATDPGISKTGSAFVGSFLSAIVNQRFHIDLGTAKIIKSFNYSNYHDSAADTTIGYKTFTVWGSNTQSDFDDLVYANDGTWTQLTASITQLLEHTAADEADIHSFTITNSTAYKYYAIKFADNWGNVTNGGLRHIEGIAEPATITAATIISDSFTAITEAETANIIILQEDVGAVTINTDIIASVSRDGGATYSTVTLENSGTDSNGKNILTGEIDVSTQPSGSAMVHKIVTTAVEMKIHGAGLQWQ